jgi:hypothetical protein
MLSRFVSLHCYNFIWRYFGGMIVIKEFGAVCGAVGLFHVKNRIGNERIE